MATRPQIETAERRMSREEQSSMPPLSLWGEVYIAAKIEVEGWLLPVDSRGGSTVGTRRPMQVELVFPLL